MHPLKEYMFHLDIDHPAMKEYIALLDAKVHAADFAADCDRLQGELEKAQGCLKMREKQLRYECEELEYELTALRAAVREFVEFFPCGGGYNMEEKKQALERLRCAALPPDTKQPGGKE